jgi:hypothetical protein
MHKVQVKFGQWIEDGFILYKENFKTLVMASIFVVVISTITAGILAGPMLAGLAIVILEMRDRKTLEPEAGSVFKGFDHFVQSFLFVAVWGIGIAVASMIAGAIPVIGSLAAFFLAYAAQALLMFGLFLIVDRQTAFWPASLQSIDTVKANFWPFFVLSLIAGIIGGAGAIAFGIGVIFTIPIQGCILAVAYRDVFGRQQRTDDR